MIFDIPSLRVIGSPLEMLDGEPRLARMRQVILMWATAVLAACAAQQPMPDDQAAARLDQARTEIAPPLGATTYILDRRRLLDQPGGENRSLVESLGQLPGVTLGPNGQLHVRDQ